MSSENSLLVTSPVQVKNIWHTSIKKKISEYFDMEPVDIYRIAKILMHLSILVVMLILWFLHLKKFERIQTRLNPNDSEQRKVNDQVYKWQKYFAESNIL